MPHHNKDSPVAAIFPIRHASVAQLPKRLLPFIWIETPTKLAPGRIQRDHAQLGCGGVEHSTHNDRIALHLRIGKRITRIKGPGQAELMNVLALDPREGGVVDTVRRPPIDSPLAVPFRWNTSVATQWTSGGDAKRGN